jgi:hypothetical protein
MGPLCSRVVPLPVFHIGFSSDCAAGVYSARGRRGLHTIADTYANSIGRYPRYRLPCPSQSHSHALSVGSRRHSYTLSESESGRACVDYVSLLSVFHPVPGAGSKSRGDVNP